MANLFPTAQKICWLSLSFFSASSADAQSGNKENNVVEKSDAKSSSPGSDSPAKVRRRRIFWPLSSSNSSSDSSDQFTQNGCSELISEEEAEAVATNNMGVFKSGGKNLKGRSRLPTLGRQTTRGNGSDGNETGESIGSGSEGCSCKSVVVEDAGQGGGIQEECAHLCKRILSFQDAPCYLRFNPYITGGYRGMLSPKECVKSIFWWTNETLNIWSHLLGWFFFFGLTIYDALGLLEVPTMHPTDRVVFTILLISFQCCCLLSSLYHIFCCHSEIYYRRWLSVDLLGVSVTLLAVYISGIYYAFSCVPFWLNFYLLTVGAIFLTAMIMQILPVVSKKEMVTEERFHWRLMVFGGWAAYGVIPTFHWACLHGGFQSEAVTLLLPRIFGMYVISGFAFIFYVARIPEKFWPGLVNYVGSSHQLWHILIFVSLVHWSHTGLIYLKFRATHPCSEEYAALFPNESDDNVLVQF